MNGTAMDPTVTGDNVGAQENRLSLNPNDERWPEVLNWQDEQEYTFTNVKVRQLSPGEFEVLSADAPGTPADEPDTSTEAPPSQTASAKGSGNYPNPAVAGLM